MEAHQSVLDCFHFSRSLEECSTSNLISWVMTMQFTDLWSGIFSARPKSPTTALHCPFSQRTRQFYKTKKHIQNICVPLLCICIYYLKETLQYKSSVKCLEYTLVCAWVPLTQSLCNKGPSSVCTFDVRSLWNMPLLWRYSSPLAISRLRFILTDQDRNTSLFNSCSRLPPLMYCNTHRGQTLRASSIKPPDVKGKVWEVWNLFACYILCQPMNDSYLIIVSAH